jgi:hypothetical protein
VVIASGDLSISTLSGRRYNDSCNALWLAFYLAASPAGGWLRALCLSAEFILALDHALARAQAIR